MGFAQNPVSLTVIYIRLLCCRASVPCSPCVSFLGRQTGAACFAQPRRKTTLPVVRNPCRHQTSHATFKASTRIIQLQHKAPEPGTKSDRSYFLITEPVFHGQATMVLHVSQMTDITTNMVTYRFSRTEEMGGRATL